MGTTSAVLFGLLGIYRVLYLTNENLTYHLIVLSLVERFFPTFFFWVKNKTFWTQGFVGHFSVIDLFIVLK